MKTFAKADGAAIEAAAERRPIAKVNPAGEGRSQRYLTALVLSPIDAIQPHGEMESLIPLNAVPSRPTNHCSSNRGYSYLQADAKLLSNTETLTGTELVIKAETSQYQNGHTIAQFRRCQ